MRTRLRSAITVVGAVSLAAALATSAFATPAQPSHPTSRLASNVLPGLAHLAPLGPAPQDEVLTLGVGLQRPDAAGENALLTAMYDPNSPAYHHFLTPAQIGARFGVPAATTNSLVHRLTAAGLHVDNVSTARDYISVHGPVSAVDKAFGVQEMSYRSSGVTFVANAAAPLVRTEDHVISVVGLNTLQHFVRPSDTRPARPDNARAQDICTGGVCTGDTTPQDLWGVYEQPAAYKGQGQRMAIIGEGKPDATVAALKKFEAHFTLPTVPLTVHCVEQGNCGTDTAGDPEWQIDTQASTGMAPNVRGEDLYFAKAITDGSLNNAFLGWIDDPNGPKQASASLGECEAGPANGVLTGPLGAIDGNLNQDPTSVLALGNGEESVLDPQLKKAVLQGRTLFASTGDTGSSCPVVYLPVLGAGNGVANQGYPDVNYPAASPYAVAVGGTVLYTNQAKTAGNTTRALEYAWTFGGGGTSFFEAAPSWQKQQPNVVGRCLSSADGKTTTSGVLCRGLPDVAAQSGDVLTNGYSVCDKTGSCGPGGGTSLSSPLWLGMWSRVQGAAPRNLGFAAPALYKVGNNPTTEARDFYDITIGDNGVYPTTPGWDYTTGFGTPRVAGLIRDVADVRPTTPVAGRGTGAGGGGGGGNADASRAAATAAADSRSGQLAFTGLGVGLPAGVALVALAGALACIRLRRRI